MIDLALMFVVIVLCVLARVAHGGHMLTSDSFGFRINGRDVVQGAHVKSKF